MNIKVYNLDSVGVIVDSNPIENPDGQFKQTQNGVSDPLGQAGSLRKRPGLKKFNTPAAGGSILGGIPMAVAGTGGAPVTNGGSSTGDSTGAGDGTGAPGATSDGSANPTFTAPGASTFGGGALFSGARLIVIGRDSNVHGAGSGGVGWYVTSKKFQDAAQVVTTPGPPGKVYSYPPTAVFPGAQGNPGVWHAASGYLFYAAQAVDQSVGTAITIRKTNGGSDVLVCTVPTSGGSSAYATGTTIRYAVVSMTLGSDGIIYLAMKDKADGQNTGGNWGTIFKLDPAVGSLTQVNTTTTPGATPNGYAGIPYCVTKFNGHIWWGEASLVSSEFSTAVVANIYALTTDENYAQQDNSFSNSPLVAFLYPFPQTAPASNPSLDVAANQCLFAGQSCRTTGTPAHSFIYKRTRGAIGTASWTGVKQGSGGTAANGNYMASAVEFNSKLYVSYYNPAGGSAIFELTPNYASLDTDGFWDGTGTWTSVYTNGSTFVPLYLFVDDGVIYAIGSTGLGGSHLALWSIDGASWTDGTTNAIPNGGDQSIPLPILAGFTQ